MLTNYKCKFLVCFSTILEKKTDKRLNTLLNKGSALSKGQFGFRNTRSTKYAVLELSDKISKASDEKEYTIGVFLNLS